MTDRDDSFRKWVQAGHHWKEMWWENDDAKRMLRALLADITADPKSKLVVTPGLKPDGSLTLWHCVENGDGTYAEGFDNSHPCPPFC